MTRRVATRWCWPPSCTSRWRTALTLEVCRRCTSARRARTAFAGWDLAAAQETAKARHFLGLASEQSVYNGIGLLPWSPLAGGLLAGAAAKATAGRRGDDNAMLGHSAREKLIADNLTRLQAYEAIAADLDLTATVLALAWLLSRPGVTAAVLGPRTLEQLTGSLPALDATLDPQAVARLDELFPGPGEAPDAYTW
jgi:NDP-hexose 2,3-enoyl reductase